MWKEKLKLNDGDTLRHDNSYSKGFMSEEDVTEYTVLNALGEPVGQVVYRNHTAVRGFRTTLHVRQTDQDGKEIVDVSWSR